MSRSLKSIISKKHLALSVSALAGLQQLAMASGAYAGTANAVLSANASITAECFLSDATLAFGQSGALNHLTPSQSTMTALGSVPWNCTNGTTATLAAATDTVPVIGSVSANGTLTAGLSFASAGGAGASASGATLVGTGVSSTQAIYGQIVVPTTAKADIYAGTVGLTINY
ncbi:MAG: hypothetical protein JWO83_1052 [Caulobacteraceae bacterium]|nr:hypothetical protein [Caulobacteraceae bacterium]